MMDWRTQKGETGAVVLRSSNRYVTFGSVPEADSLRILRVEQLPREWLPQRTWYDVGKTVYFPITAEQPFELYVERMPEEAREVWEGYEQEGKNNFTTLRAICSERGLDLPDPAHPSKEEMVDALIEECVPLPSPSANSSVPALAGELDLVRVPVEYPDPITLYEGIQEAGGPASEEALSVLAPKVRKWEEMEEVVEDYRRIGEGDDLTVEDVAAKHEVSVRSVYRYADAVLDDSERILKAARAD